MWCVTTSVNWTKIVYLTRKLQVILLRCVRIFNKDLAVHSSLLPVPGLLQRRPWLRKKTQGLGKRDYSWHANQFPIGKLIFIKLRTRTDGHSRSIILTAPTGSPISPSSAWRSSIVVSIRFELRLCRRHLFHSLCLKNSAEHIISRGCGWKMNYFDLSVSHLRATLFN